MSDDPFKLDMLCGHHSLERFRSGLDHFDGIARRLHQRVLMRDTHDFAAVAATAGSTEISGLVSVTESRLVGLDVNGTSIEGRWVVYQLLVIDLRHQGSDLIKVLLNELQKMGSARLRDNIDCVGEAASPVLWRPAHHIGLTSYLDQNGFRPDSYGWWFRPRASATSQPPS